MMKIQALNEKMGLSGMWRIIVCCIKAGVSDQPGGSGFLRNVDVYVYQTTRRHFLEAPNHELALFARFSAEFSKLLLSENSTL
jgi:hypothetical protein